MINVTVTNPTLSLKNAVVVVHYPQDVIRLTNNVSPGGIVDSTNRKVTWTVQDLGTGASELLWLRPEVNDFSPRPRLGTLQQYEVEIRATNEVPLWTAETSRVIP